MATGRRLVEKPTGRGRTWQIAPGRTYPRNDPSVLPQDVTDITGLPQDVPAETVGAAYGDALLAAQGVGLVAPDASWAQIVETVIPESRVRSLYDELYSIYRSLYSATREQAHTLAAIQRREGR